METESWETGFTQKIMEGKSDTSYNIILCFEAVSLNEE